MGGVSYHDHDYIRRALAASQKENEHIREGVAKVILRHCGPEQVDGYDADAMCDDLQELIGWPDCVACEIRSIVHSDYDRQHTCHRERRSPQATEKDGGKSQ